MEGLEQKCQRRRNKRLSRGWVKNDDEFAGQGMQDQKIAACGSSCRVHIIRIDTILASPRSLVAAAEGCVRVRSARHHGSEVMHKKIESAISLKD
jgi:hypothetical protein